MNVIVNVQGTLREPALDSGKMCEKYTERRHYTSTARTSDVVWCAVMKIIVARVDVRNTVVGKHFLNDE